MCACSITSVVSNSLRSHGLYPARFLSMGFSGKEHWSGSHSLLQEIFPSRAWNLSLFICKQIIYCWATRKAPLCNNTQLKKWVNTASCWSMRTPKHDHFSKSVRERQQAYDITHWWNLSINRNEITSETDSESQKSSLYLTKEKGQKEVYFGSFGLTCRHQYICIP